MNLTDTGLQERQAWEKAGIEIPSYDRAAMVKKTKEAPGWVHFGAGNIFRGFIAGLQDALLEEGLADTGIIAAETFDFDIMDKIYGPFNHLKGRWEHGEEGDRLDRGRREGGFR